MVALINSRLKLRTNLRKYTLITTATNNKLKLFQLEKKNFVNTKRYLILNQKRVIRFK